MGHVHAELMKQYAEDAVTSETPWINWEFRSFDDLPWQSMHQHPAWHVTTFYRRKPVPVKDKILINGEKFNSIAKEPDYRSKYSRIELDQSGFNATSYTWLDDDIDYRFLASGNIFETRTQAQAVADKLNQVFKNKVE